MLLSRRLGVALVFLASGVSAKAQTYSLAEAPKKGDCLRLKLEMRLAGEIHVNRDGSTTPLKLEAKAGHELYERILSVGKDGQPEKVCRFYERAVASIAVAANLADKTLRPDRRLVVSQRTKDRLIAYSPSGPLTREELDLVGEHLDTLSLGGLLPGSAVAVGATWKVSSAVVQAMCGFEGLTEQAIDVKFEGVQGTTALIHLSGTAAGIELGSLVKTKIQGSVQYDLKTRHITALEWKQHDERELGPASPAATVDTTTTLSRAPVDLPDTLSDTTLAGVPEGMEPSPYLLQLDYRDSRNRFDLSHSREWQVVSRTSDHVVMRLMDAGEFMAQATITPWSKAEIGKHQSPDQFRLAMDQTPGWKKGEELQAGELPADQGRWIYRIAAQGELDGAKVVQHFYLVAGPAGEQVVMVITMTPKQAARLAGRDLSLASSLYFPPASGDKPK